MEPHWQLISIPGDHIGDGLGLVMVKYTGEVAPIGIPALQFHYPSLEVEAEKDQV